MSSTIQWIGQNLLVPVFNIEIVSLKFGTMVVGVASCYMLVSALKKFI